MMLGKMRAGGEGDNRGWDGWMASLTQWTWVWVDSGSWWWIGRPGVLWFVGSQRVRDDWVTELNWTGKTIALTIWTFVSKVVSLLFNILSMLGSQKFVYDWSDWTHTHAVCYSFPAKKQSSSNFMAKVSIHCDFRAQEEEICHCLHLFGGSFLSGSYSKESACIVG